MALLTVYNPSFSFHYTYIYNCVPEDLWSQAGNFYEIYPCPLSLRWTLPKLAAEGKSEIAGNSNRRRSHTQDSVA